MVDQQDHKNRCDAQESSAGMEDFTAPAPLKVFVKTLTGSILSFQLSPTDSTIELKQLITENLETCYFTSFALQLEGETMADFAAIGDANGMSNNVTIDMVHVPYDERTAREQVYRLRELLEKPLDECYVASGNLEKVSSSKIKSFPSLNSIIEHEFPHASRPTPLPSSELEEMLPEPAMWTEMASALDVDHEINAVGKVLGRGILSHLGGGADSLSPSGKRKGRKSRHQSAAVSAADSEFDSKQVFEPSIASEDVVASESLKPLSRLMSATEPKLHRCLQSISFSGWNPPNAPRRMMGDLFYLEMKTLEGDVFHITANSVGFFVNGTQNDYFDPNLAKKGKQAQTLLGLIWDLSLHVRRDFPRLLLARMKRHPFEVSPLPFPMHQWIDNPISQTYSMARVEDFMCNMMGVDWRIQQREWNEEYQSCRELPVMSTEEGIIRDRTVFKIHCDFVEASIRGAKAVVEKNLTPINPLDPKPAQVFIQNNIFFSFALDDDLGEDKEILKAFDLDKDAYSKAGNDLKGVIAFNKVNTEKIHTLATTIVDYKGYRVVAQSLIPGILQGDHGSKHCYGNMEEKVEEENASLFRLTTPLKPNEIQLKKGFVWSDEYHNMVKQSTEKLHVKEHTIVDPEGKEHPFASAAECKGIMGSDGRYYILDLVGIFPRDTNFLDQENAFIRPELIHAYIRKAETKDTVSTTTSSESGGKPHNIDDSAQIDPAAAHEKRIEFVKSVLSEEKKPSCVRFNPNTFSSKIKLAGTPEQIKADEDDVRALADFLLTDVLPTFVQDIKNMDFLPLDGISLTSLMHSAGINMRYLGQLAKKASEAGVTFLEKLCLQEMIVRCAKHEFSRMLRRTSSDQLAKSVESFLNALLSFKEFSTAGKKKKGTSSQSSSTSIVLEYVEGKPPVLTSSALRRCLMDKIRQKYQYDISEHLFREMPRYSTLRSFCLRTGLKVLCRDYDFSTKTPFQMSDVLDLVPLVKHATPDSLPAHKLLDAGRDQIEKGQVENAFECLSQAMVMFQQVKGGLNQEVAECFNLLATLLFQVSDLGQSLLHQHKAFLICRRVEGIDCANLIQMHQLLGMLCNSLGQNEFALKHFYRAKYMCELVCGFDTPDLAVIEYNIATMLQFEPKASLQFFESALKKNKKLLGENHLSVGEIYHSMALSHSSQRDFENALQCEKKALAILKTHFDATHARIQESAKFLEIFTTRAVEQNRFMSRTALKEYEGLNRLLQGRTNFLDRDLFRKKLRHSFK
eukprot:CAMPEP_0117435546 /NCGR_PEP_ID=MMETSP0759-20121206/538_1 /TAXON_ID=63605 /ORGANISM="Percolomonas cosmopolitus, Strain WS" /LENGTH=1249 /DNA_ID=CAMNT_0005227099 /DNA_START=204 /DNA_END=3953 /DNA_ORIENTATION=+